MSRPLGGVPNLLIASKTHFGGTNYNHTPSGFSNSVSDNFKVQDDVTQYA